MTRKIDRTGEKMFNNKELGGYEFIIVEYNNSRDLWIEFQDEHKARVHTNYTHCLDGKVKNPYHPICYNVGFIGQGEYNTDTTTNSFYYFWHGILERGCSETFKSKHPTYKNVKVCDEWLNFQNFAEWCSNNYYEVEGERMQLDKDIICKSNKIYSPDKCIFVPHRINSLFIKNDALRGDLPIGVGYDKRRSMYRAYCSIIKKDGNRITQHVGYYNSPEEAFKGYKRFKEAYIKQIADEYKGKIPQRLYDAMYTWTVEEDD